MRVVALDFETFFSTEKDNVYSIREQGAWKYVHDDRFNCYLISVSDGKETWSGSLSEFNWQSLEGARLVSHNRYFDELVYNRLVELNLAPQVAYHDWHDTAALSVYLSGRRDLARAAEYLLGVPVDKSYRIDADGKHWEDMVKADVAEKVKEAGRVDALLCWKLWNQFSDQWPEEERKLSDLTIRSGQRGFQIDVPKLKQYLVVAQGMLIQAEQELPWVKEGRPPTSPKALAEMCRKVGIPCSPVKSRDGEEAYEKWASTYGGQHSFVKAVTDYRVVNKFIGSLETIRDRLHPDGTMSYDLLYGGAHTMRWSGGGGFNVQNLRKFPLICDTDGRLVTDETRLKEISTSKTSPSFVAHVLDIRALIIPRPGTHMIICDLNTIEPRVLAWLTNDTAMLASMAAGMSIYEAHARSTLGWTGGELKKEDKEKYAFCKVRILGLSYGAGWRKFLTIAKDLANLDLTADDPETVPELDENGAPTGKTVSGYGLTARRFVNEFRESNPLLCGPNGLWRRLDDAFRNSVGGDFVLTLPSGRQLKYPSVSRVKRLVEDPDKPGKFLSRWQTTAAVFNPLRGGVVRQGFYGSLFVENLCQAIARDCFAMHLLELDSTPGVKILFHIHDEVILEVEPEITVKQVEGIMSKTPEWLPGCSLSAEGAEVSCFRK